jgi:hypothetical protein
MKSAALLGAFIVLALAISLSGQTATTGSPMIAIQNQPAAATRIGAHRIGETFSEWIAVAHVDLAGLCRKHEQPRGEEEECRDLSLIRDTGLGDYSDYSLNPKGKDSTWAFADGKLQKLIARYSLDELPEQMGFLRDAYGAATKIDTVPVQNAFGAKWSDTVAVWSMPDGATITLTARGGPNSYITVVFRSKDLAKAQAPDNKPNPYKSKQ